MELHEFLDQWREGRGWSIQRLADELHVSQSLVSKWLHTDPRRRVRPNRPTLRRIAVLTSASRLDLMRMAGYVEDEDLVDQPAPLDPDLVLLNATWPRLAESVREAIRTVLAGAGARGLIETYLPAFASGA